jgi:hypothetical protein
MLSAYVLDPARLPACTQALQDIAKMKMSMMDRSLLRSHAALRHRCAIRIAEREADDR